MTKNNSVRRRRHAAVTTTICSVAGAAAGLSVFALRASAQQNAAGQAAPAASATATAPVALPLPTQPPRGAIVLFGGRADQLQSNFYRRYTTNPANWTVDNNGVATPQKADIATRREFGDCYLHVEFRTPPGMGGNSGIGFQGRYELQILGDYGKTPESHGSAALYSQKASMVNASKRSGEWQTYDIIFRSPRFDAAGTQVTEKPRATVFHNGVLVQNNAEFTGMTGIQYGQYKAMTPTGPLVLQGDHDPVQFRNVWIVPL